MRSATRVERAFLVLAVIASLVLAVVLIGGLDEITFRPGRPLVRSASDTDADSTQAVSSQRLTRGELIAAYVLAGFTLLSIGGVVLFRRLRRQFLQYLFFFAASVLPLLLGAFLLARLFAPRLSDSPEVAAEGPLLTSPLLSNPPTWLLAAASGLLSLFILCAVVFFLRRWQFIRRHLAERSQEKAQQEIQLETLADYARQTATRIRKGNPLRGEVIRCYQEMDRLLARATPFKPTYLTPREFEKSLLDRGIDSEHVRQLTELFELVRYGSRDDEQLAERALTCLDQIEARYGSQDPSKA